MQHPTHTWILEFADGSLVEEYPEDDSGPIPLGKLLECPDLVRIHLKPDMLDLLPYVLNVRHDGDFRPILFRRVHKQVRADDLAEIGEVRLTVLGWQRTIQGQNIKSFTVIYPDGSVLITDDDGAF